MKEKKIQISSQFKFSCRKSDKHTIKFAHTNEKFGTPGRCSAKQSQHYQLNYVNEVKIHDNAAN
jgi:hypothetical protein